jgi:hypothetical protein
VLRIAKTHKKVSARKLYIALPNSVLQQNDHCVNCDVARKKTVTMADRKGVTGETMSIEWFTEWRLARVIKTMFELGPNEYHRAYDIADGLPYTVFTVCDFIDILEDKGWVSTANGSGEPDEYSAMLTAEGHSQVAALT